MRPSLFQFFKTLFITLVTLTGLSLSVLSVIADFIGLSEPGFGTSQMKPFLLGLALLISGTVLIIKRKSITHDAAQSILAQFLQFIKTNKADFIIVLLLFCISVTIGTAYFIRAKSIAGFAFYAPTLNQPFPIANIPLAYGFSISITAVILYCIFRLGMGRLISALCSFIIMTSPIHLYNLIPSLQRDYIKAPFILAVVLIMGLLVAFPFSKSRMTSLSVLGGILTGIGLWFRMDVAILTPLFALVLLFFSTSGIRQYIADKLKASLLYILIVMFFSVPLSVIDSSTFGYHVSTGLVSYFDSRLGVSGAGYNWGHQFSDEFIASNVYSQVKSDKEVSFEYDKINYSSGVGYKFIKKLFRHFPADMLTRVYASVLKIIDLPFVYTEPPIGVTNNLALIYYNLRASVLNLLAGSGIYLVILAIYFVSFNSLRKSLFMFFSVIYLAGYPVIQFFGRHYFHLEFISLWALGFVFQSLIKVTRHLLVNKNINSVVDVLSRPATSNWWKIFISRSLVLICILFSLIMPLYLFRQYQIQKTKTLFNEYIGADVERIPVIKLPFDKNNILVTNYSQFKPKDSELMSVDYLVAEFSTKPGDLSTIWPTIYYDNKVDIPEFYGRPTFSKTIDVNFVNSAKTRLYFPVMYLNPTSIWPSMYFEGLKIPKEQSQNFSGLYRIKNPNRFPFMLTTAIPFSGEKLVSYQQLIGWETKNLYTVPIDIPSGLSAKLLDNSVKPINNKDILFKDRSLITMKKNKWEIKGYAIPQYNPYFTHAINRNNSDIAKTLFDEGSTAVIDTDLLITKKFKLKRGDYLVAQGKLFTGGVTFGLIRNKTSQGYVNVTSPGDFSVLIMVQKNGLYSLGISNNVDGYTSLENRFIINKIGWITD